MRRTIPIPLSTSSVCKFGADRKMSPAVTTLIIWGQVPIGGLIGAPIGGRGLTGKRDERDSRERRDAQRFEVRSSRFPELRTSDRACSASLALPARLACSPPVRPDDPLVSIVTPTEGKIFLILGQRFRQVFSMQLIENTQIVMGFSIVGLQRDGSLIGSLRLIKPIQLGIDH